MRKITTFFVYSLQQQTKRQSDAVHYSEHMNAWGRSISVKEAASTISPTIGKKGISSRISLQQKELEK
jgi:hypothetical protein